MAQRRNGATAQGFKLPSLEGLGVGFNKSTTLEVSRIKLKTSIILTIVFLILFVSMWKTLDHFTDSPVPGWDSFIASLSIIATWMLARKFYEHWYLWIVVNAVAVLLFLSRGLYPTVVLYSVYCVMSFIGLKEWRKTISQNSPFEEPAPPQRGGRGITINLKSRRRDLHGRSIKANGFRY